MDVISNQVVIVGQVAEVARFDVFEVAELVAGSMWITIQHRIIMTQLHLHQAISI